MSNLRKVLLGFLVLLFVASGIGHFIIPTVYQQIMPPYLPYQIPLIYFSGVCELLFGIGLVFPQTRSKAAWLIIAMLAAVYPANIQMFIKFNQEHNPYLWFAILRLPLQIVLIWMVWLFTKKR